MTEKCWEAHKDGFFQIKTREETLTIELLLDELEKKL